MPSIAKMMRSVALGALLLSGGARAPAEAGPARGCRVAPGANFQVTDTPGDAYMFEPVLAIDPRNPRRLFAAAMLQSPDGRTDVRPYYSRDGGRSWREGERTQGRHQTSDTGLIHTRRFGPILYGNPGSPEPNVISRPQGDMRAWRDTRLPFGNLDKPTLVEGRQAGPAAGRMLFFGMMAERTAPSGPPRYLLKLFTTDDMVTWSGHDVTTSDVVNRLVSAGPGGYAGLNTGNDILQTSEGTLFLPFFRFDLNGGATFWRVNSPDGGTRFGPPAQLARRDGSPLLSEGAGTFPAYAIDQSGGVFRDRIYALWFEVRGETVHLLLSHSDDVGGIWSDPVQVDEFVRFGPQLSANSTYHVLPSVEVNRYGTLILTWYRSEAAGATETGRRIISYRRHATASVDGGATLLSTVPLASQAGATIKAAGDYLQTVADRNGTFHEAWLDARTGKFEVWYAPIRVLCGNRPARAR